MGRLYKGLVDYRKGEDFHMVCVGPYWDWPWWKRALSRMFRYLYREFYRERARFQWRHDKDRLKEIGRDFYLESAFAIADTHIQPLLL